MHDLNSAHIDNKSWFKMYVGNKETYPVKEPGSKVHGPISDEFFIGTPVF